MPYIEYNIAYIGFCNLKINIFLFGKFLYPACILFYKPQIEHNGTEFIFLFGKHFIQA